MIAQRNYNSKKHQTLHVYRTLPGGDEKHRASHWSHPFLCAMGLKVSICTKSDGTCIHNKVLYLKHIRGDTLRTNGRFGEHNAPMNPRTTTL